MREEGFVVIAHFLELVVVRLDDSFFRRVFKDVVALAERREVRLRGVLDVVVWVSSLDLRELRECPLQLPIDGRMARRDSELKLRLLIATVLAAFDLVD